METMSSREYFVYILCNRRRTLYVGFTNDLERRLAEHKSKEIHGFTSKYNITQLVWYSSTNDVEDAIAFEKRIKGWTRAKKTALNETENPEWKDLAVDWF